MKLWNDLNQAFTSGVLDAATWQVSDVHSCLLTRDGHRLLGHAVLNSKFNSEFKIPTQNSPTEAM